MAKNLNYQAPPALAIAEGATTPALGATMRGVSVWSTTLGKPVYWTGTAWTAGGTGGGGGTPGGTAGQLQYNDAGAFGGAVNVVVDGDNLKLLPTDDPAVPTDGLVLYAKSIAGYVLPKVVGPSGIDTLLQVGIDGNSVFFVSPTTGTTAPLAVGGTITTAATMSSAFTANSTNKWSATFRKRFQTATTAANTTGMRTAYGQWFRGSAAGYGGFRFRSQFGMQINLAGGQKFVGLCALTTALAGDPSALLNMCGVGYDAADASTGNWFFMRNDGAGVATKVDLGVGAARNTTDGYDLVMGMRPGGSELYVRVINLNTGATVLETSYTTDIPAANVAMAFKSEVRNGAVAAADNLEVAKAYIQTDY